MKQLNNVVHLLLELSQFIFYHCLADDCFTGLVPNADYGINGLNDLIVVDADFMNLRIQQFILFGCVCFVLAEITPARSCIEDACTNEAGPGVVAFQIHKGEEIHVFFLGESDINEFVADGHSAYPIIIFCF